MDKNKQKQTNTQKKKRLYNKKGFAFSILSLFLVLLTFAFGSLYLFQEDFTINANFREARITYLNSELEYFKTTYINNAIQYSTFNTINELLFYLNSSDNFSRLNSNYSNLNSLVLEGLTKGTFDGTPIPNLANKNINNLTNSFKDNFETNYHGNFSFEILNLTLSETQSYFIDVQLMVNYSVNTEDKLNEWNFIDEFIIKVPIYDLTDPEFLIHGGKVMPVKSSEFHLPNLNWTLKTFNKTMVEGYSTVFYKPAFDYTLGQSYLQRILNMSHGGFYGVVAQFSFDLDEQVEGIYDTSQNQKLGSLYGPTIVLVPFDNMTQPLIDRTSYNNSITNHGTTICSDFSGIFQDACVFDDDAKYIELNNPSNELEFLPNFSISIWVNLNQTPSGTQTILDSVFDLKVTTDETIEFSFTSTSGLKTINTSTPLGINVWRHILLSYDGSEIKYYLDGKYNETFPSFPANSQPFNNIFIGANSSENENFKGKLDELGIYKQTLSEVEVSSIYTFRRTQFIEYVNTVFVKGLELKSNTNYATIPHNDSFDFGIGDFSFCTWFKTPERFRTSDNQQILSKRENDKTNGAVEIEIDSTNNKLLGFINNQQLISNNPLLENTYYYGCLVRESNDGKLYLNGEFQSSVVAGGDINSPNDLYFGKDEHSDQYFNGIIDEIKIYNRSLKGPEIELNYRNYASFGKGCCNYITLVNQNVHGFRPGYSAKVPSTSTLFFNNYKKSILNNIYVYNSTNLTTNDQSDNSKFYNLLLDDCMFESYNFLDYDPMSRNDVNPVNLGEVGTNTCSNLIKKGIY